MSKEPPKSVYELSRRLLVEGQNEVYSIAELYEKQTGVDILTDLQIVNKESFEKLRKSLKTELKSDELSILGIIIDNDFDENRYTSIADRLRENDIIIPELPEANGCVIRQE